MSGIPPNSLFSALSFVGFLLAGLPVPWHMQSWNTGTCMFMLWTSFGCLVLFVNSIMWNDNVINWAPVWCDICVHYLIGASVGIPASSFCIIRRLYYITKLQTISVEKETRRCEIRVDISIGVGLPCAVMVLEYVVQVQRFAIVEQIGCYPAIANTLAAYFLIYMWPLLIGLISLVYAALTFRRAFLQKSQLRRMLHTGLFISAGRYWRLMALCGTEIVFTVPLSLYIIIMNALATPPGPYVSWAWIHSGFSQIEQYPSVVWQAIPDMAVGVEISRWFYILCAFVIFAFFGWGKEARDFYGQTFWSICCRLGCSKSIMVSRGALYTGNPITPVRRNNRWIKSKRPRLVAGDQPLRTSLSAFEAPARSESVCSSLRPSVGEGSIDHLPRLPSLGDLACHTRISWTSMLAMPEPALTIDRCPRASYQDMAQLV